jgi:branched-chain amino acid transport system permease protein
MLPQLLVNGIVQGAIYSLAALGFALILYVTGTFHFAHGAVYTWAAYLVYVAHVDWDLPIVVAAVIASVGCAVLGCAIEVLIYRPVRRRSRSHFSIVVASLGILIVLANTTQLVFGPDTKLVDSWPIHHFFTLGGVDIQLPQVVPFVVGLGISALVVLMLYRTRTGLLLRGVSINPVRSQILGARPGRAGLVAFAIGSALLGPVAALISLDQGVSPTIGLDMVLIAAIATIAGGVRRPAAAIGGAIILACAENVGIWKIDSEWKATVGYGVLLLLITLRPYGIFGSREVGELRGG